MNNSKIYQSDFIIKIELEKTAQIVPKNNSVPDIYDSLHLEMQNENFSLCITNNRTMIDYELPRAIYHRHDFSNVDLILEKVKQVVDFVFLNYNYVSKQDPYSIIVAGHSTYAFHNLKPVKKV